MSILEKYDGPEKPENGILGESYGQVKPDRGLLEYEPAWHVDRSMSLGKVLW